MNRSALKYFLLSLLTLMGCSEDPELNHLLDARSFTLNTPGRWTLSEGTGYDSYFGEIRGSLGIIYFDQGVLSFNGLESVSADGSTVYLTNLIVDGVPAILHKTRIKDNDRQRALVTLYIEKDGGHRNRLYTFDPDPLSEKVMVDVMKTHRFK